MNAKKDPDKAPSEPTRPEFVGNVEISSTGDEVHNKSTQHELSEEALHEAPSDPVPAELEDTSTTSQALATRPRPSDSGTL